MAMHDTAYELAIGNKNWSSWSLRPWLVLTAFGLPFREINIPLRMPGTAGMIRLHSPSSKVPVLKSGDLVVWDSLAIIEFLAEAHGAKPIWPQDAGARAIARSVSAEMHAGFYALRAELPMDLLSIRPFPATSEAARADIRRLMEIWEDCRARFGAEGPYLFGVFSAADAMFAPAASRLRSYSVDMASFGGETAAAYCQTVLTHEAMLAWEAGARREVSGGLPTAGSFA